MTLRHLEIFVEVANCGKMSEAARRLYIAQSSVSQAIAEIERQYNVKLFERLSKRLYLTVPGEEMLGYARHIISIYKEMEEHMKFKANSVCLRIGATPTIGICMMSDLIRQFNSLMPQANVEVMIRNTVNLEMRVLRSELDLCLLEGQIKNQDLIARPIMEDRLILVCSQSHPFCQRAVIDPEELYGQQFILNEKGNGTRELIERYLNRHEIKIREKWMCNNSETVKQAVIDNYGITIISEMLVCKELESGELHKVEISGDPISYKLYLVYHKNKYFFDALKTFVQVCENYKKPTIKLNDKA